MAIKLGRNYELRVQGQFQSFLVFNYPLTVKFNIQRNNLVSVNTGTFELINLNINSRSSIRKDEWNIKYDKSVVFYAGYGDDISALSLCFSGKVQHAFSVRQGVDFVTTITGFDDPVAVKQTYFENKYRAGESYLKLMEDIVAQFKINGISRGAISKRIYYPATKTAILMADKKFVKDKTIQGPAMNVIGEYFGPKAYIDNGTINFLNEDEYARASLRTISSETGLLGTPRQSNQVVYVDIMFEPGISCGQLINVLSTENAPNLKNPNFNGLYRVMGITHKGTISGAMGGEAVTSLALVKFVVKPLEVLVGG